MPIEPVQRRLAAGVVGWSRLTGTHELGTRARSNAPIEGVVRPAVAGFKQM